MSLVPGAQTVHTRESWQDPKYPVFGPLDDPTNNVTAVIHYTADDDLIDGDPGEHAEDLPAYMRAMQKSYVLNRGYSLGYLWAVDWLGGIWQIRGWEYQSAANKGENATTWPILVLVDGDDPATPEAAESIRLLIAEAGRRSGSPLFIRGHKDIGATACPGAGLYAQIKAGVFTPTTKPTPPPVVTPPPPQGEPEMEAIFAPTFDPGQPNVKWWNDTTPHLAIWQTGAVTRATNAHYKLAEHKGAPVILLDSQDQYLDLVSKIGQ